MREQSLMSPKAQAFSFKTLPYSMFICVRLILREREVICGLILYTILYTIQCNASFIFSLCFYVIPK